MRSDPSVLPEIDALSPKGDDTPTVSLAKAEAAALQMRALTLSHAVEDATRWFGLVQQNGIRGGTGGALLVKVSEHWMQTFGAVRASTDPRELESELRSDGQAAWLLDLRAAEILNRPMADAADGLVKARRLARMARTEGIVDRELVATLVLARARRLTGQPYLGVRILELIARFSPALFQPAICIELLLSGAGLPRGINLGTLEPLNSLLEATRSEDRQAFGSLRERALAAVLGRVWQGELRTLLALIDPDEPEIPEAARDWCYGVESDSPFGLRDPLDTWALPSVVVRPGKPTRRVHASGVALGDEHLDRIALGSDAQGAVGSGVAMVALAGEAGVPAVQVFEEIEARGGSSDRSQGAARILLHRMRKALNDAGTIERRGDTLYLVPNAAFAVQDPRCAASLTDRVLFEVVRQGGAMSSKKLSERMTLSVRTVQNALKTLVDEGLCDIQRVGREVYYRVEDTVFSEPSVQRWFPS